ncbi:MAG TPA: hypothetical protein VMV41_04850 [Cellulomonadaceae bacterium]|nr:hypothetical protein [Cellulomonadaceae bacterium]
MTRNAVGPSARRAPVLAAGLGLLLAIGGCTSTSSPSSANSAATTGSTTQVTGAATASPTGSPPTSAVSGPATTSSTPATEPGEASPPTKAAVPLSQPADFGTGVVAKLDKIESIVATAHGPGEISGPALAFTITVTNGSSGVIDLGSVIVNLTDANGDPGVSMFGSPASLLSGLLAAGASATGVYVFSVAPSADSSVRLDVSYSTQAPTVVFSGDPASR